MNNVRKVLALASVVTVGFSMTLAPSFAVAKNMKDESVYVITDSTGSQTETIVSDHIINNTKSKTLNDKTNLTDIENIKGDEKFDMNGDSIAWQADGNDITYQGNTTQKTPVTMDVTYYLDGKMIEGDKLNGAKGKVRIEIKYNNNATINGTKVPFMVMSGFMADNKDFTNIKVTKGKGKVIDDGDKSIVALMAAPGLEDSLGVDTSELGFEDTVVVEGYAKNFSSQDIMTVATSSFADDVDDDLFDGYDFDSKIDKLNSSGKKLVDGSEELYNGIHLLYSKSGELEDGVSQLNDGADQVCDGTKSLKTGSTALFGGTKKLKAAINSAQDGAGQIYFGLAGDGTADNPGLKNGLKSVAAAFDGDTGLTKGSAAVADGASKVNEGLKTAKGGVDAAIGYDKATAANIATAKSSLEALKATDGLTAEQKSTIDDIINDLNTANTNVGTGKAYAESASSAMDGTSGDLGKGAAQVATGSKSVSEGAAKLESAVDNQLVPGATKLTTGAEKLYKNLAEANGEGKDVDQLVNGAKALSEGASQLNTGASKLAKGMTELNESTGTLIEGVGQLDDGSNELKNGMAKFYKEGIKKLVDLYNDDLKGVVNNADDVINAGKDYKTFTKINSEMDGQVKFVYKTEIYKEN